MDLDRIRKLAGLHTDSVQSPSQLHESTQSTDGGVDIGKEALDESETPAKSEKVDFTNKEASTLNKLEEAMANTGTRLLSLSEDSQEAAQDIAELGLRKVANVVDLGKPVYFVYENAEGQLSFYAPADPGMLQETTMTMDELVEFHNAGEDVAMREGDEVVNEGKDEDCDECPKCVKAQKDADEDEKNVKCKDCSDKNKEDK